MGRDRRSAIGALVVGLVLMGAAPASAAPHVQVSAGGGHTCAVKLDQTLVCWGLNVDGQATPPAGTFSAVSAGSIFTCAIRTDATVACWGHDDEGSTTPPTGTFKAVSAGGAHACGIRTNDTLVCWGVNALSFSYLPPAGTYTQRQRGRLQRLAVRVRGQHRPDAGLLGIQRLRPGVAAVRDLPQRRRRGRPYLRDQDRRPDRLLGVLHLWPGPGGSADRDLRRAERRL